MALDHIEDGRIAADQITADRVESAEAMLLEEALQHLANVVNGAHPSTKVNARKFLRDVDRLKKRGKL